MECIICKNKIGMMGAVKINNGCICKNCHGKIPVFLHKDVKNCNDLQILEFIEYFNIQRLKTFEQTSSYGNLMIDEMHGLIGLKNNKMDVIDVLDLKDIEIVCTDVKADTHGKVKCNVELICDMENPVIYFSTYIKKSVFCECRKVDKTSVQWLMPGDLAVIKAIINQTIDNAVKRFSKRNRIPESISKHELDIIRAKALFMLDDGYDSEMLNEQKRRLAKAFHTDNREVNDDGYMKKINYYYNILANQFNEVKR